jgi:hypothetical protein
MKKLLLMIGITGALGLVNVGTRANASTTSPTSDKPQDLCSLEDQRVCDEHCVSAGCDIGVCFPPCKCYYSNGDTCP